MAKRVREVAVVRVAQVEGELRQIPLSDGKTVGRNPHAQPLGISPEAHASGLPEDAREVEGRAIDGARQLVQTGR